MTTRTLPAHGTLSRAKYHKCHCDKCRQVSADYQRTRHRKRGYGTWQPLVDAEPVRAHLALLKQHGISYIRTAELAGLYPPTVGRLLYTVGGRKPVQRVRPETAAAILAVQPGAIDPHTTDGTGTRRRIQALVAAGWPLRRLGKHFGVNPSTPGRLLKQTTLRTATAKAITDAYQRLQRQRPEDNGIKAVDADRARRWAAGKGWPDPVWWEDYGHIDDPAFDPAAAVRALSRDELAALRRADITHLADCGYDPEAIHQRMGGEIALSTVRTVVHEHRTGVKRDRKKVAA
jgi:hypothetical protein